MIIEEKIYTCRRCGSSHLKKNGKNRYGNQQYFCKDCKNSGVLNPKNSYTEAEKEQILAAYKERPSMRGISRLYGISRNTLASWLQKKVNAQPNLKETLLPAQKDDVLELDKLWSFVRFRKNKRWIWIVLCRRTRQIVAFVIGDRSAETCQKLWKHIPPAYQSCHSFSDFWEAYEKVFPEETHRSVGKDSGQTNHVERWNCTLRQKVARFVRKTLSFSKVDYMHHIVTRWFIVEYNLQIMNAACT